MAFSITSLLAVSLCVLDPSFVHVGRYNDVEVYERKEASAISIAAVGEFAAPPAQVQAALLDYEDHPRFLKHVATSTVLARGSGALRVYQRLRLSVLKDRDYTLRVTWSEGPSRSVSFALDPEGGPPPVANAVRVGLLEGRWDLEPIRGGTATRAVYRVRINLGGMVPLWLSRAFAGRDMASNYVGMRQLVEEKSREVSSAAQNVAAR